MPFALGKGLRAKDKGQRAKGKGQKAKGKGQNLKLNSINVDYLKNLISFVHELIPEYPKLTKQTKHLKTYVNFHFYFMKIAKMLQTI